MIDKDKWFIVKEEKYKWIEDLKTNNIMTPQKEKAEELVDKMMLYSYEKIENEKNTKYIVDNKIKKEYAIQCLSLIHI